MDSYRIDIKKGNLRIPYLYTLMKWVILVYVIIASIFLIYKLYDLALGHIPFFYEWVVVILNLLLVIILSRQLLRLLNDTRYIIVAGDHITFRQNFPWASRVNWTKIRQIQFGYSRIRFVTKTGNKYRFSLSNTSPEEQSKLYEAMQVIAKKYDIELLHPQQ